MFLYKETMKKVLIIGPSFFTFNQSISDAFNKFNFITKVIPYDEPIHPFNLKTAIINKFFPLKKFKLKSRLLFNQYVCKEFCSFYPDIVFIYNGDILEIDTILYFKKTSKVAIWLLDGLYKHPLSELLANIVDAFFCFDQSDVKLLKLKGVNAHFLPQACDTTIYHPLSLKKDIDILFIGTLYGYPKRIELLKKILIHFKSYNIQIYGVYKPLYKNPIKWLLRGNREEIKNKNVSPKEVNYLYNRAKICLNIHHEQSKNGGNPKVFEIAGSKAFQLCDWNPYIEELFPNGEVSLYKNADELMYKINYFLMNDTNALANKAYENVIKNHTFVNRIKNVLNIIN